MYKSPIEIKWNDIVSDAVEKADEYIVRFVQQVGVNVDKDELIKALKYDRGQYENGWNDRDNEIVRCKDCKKYIPCQKLPIGTSKWCDLFDRATCEMNYCGWGERKEDEIEMLPTQMSGRGER